MGLTEAEARIWNEIAPQGRFTEAHTYLLVAYCGVEARVRSTSAPSSAALEERDNIAAAARTQQGGNDHTRWQAAHAGNSQITKSLKISG